MNQSITYDGEFGVVVIDTNTLTYTSKSGETQTKSFEKEVTTTAIIGDYPTFLVIGYSDGDVISIELPSFSEHLITAKQLGRVKKISSFPLTHKYLTLIVDNEDAVIVYDHLYNKTIIYSPSLPSQITSVEYFFPLSVLLINYSDGRSFAWSLDTSSMLSTLKYSLPQDRIKSHVIYQN